MLIVFEGIDGCGKGTQLRLLKEKKAFEYFKYPTKNFEMINRYLEGQVQLSSKSLFHLFLSDIANEQDKIVKSEFVVLDRYVFSTIAYEVNGISYENAKKIVCASEFLKPDLVIYIDVDPKVSYKRKKNQKKLDMYEENIQYLTKVRENYLKLYKDKFLTNNWYLIDGNAKIEEAHSKILQIFEKHKL